MDRVLAALIALIAGGALAAYGWVLLRRWKREVTRRIEFVNEFGERLLRYVNSGGRDEESYGWLTHRSNRMQNQMGRQGLIGFQPPFANFIHNNYPVILNMLPELRKSLRDSILHSQADWYANALREALIRHLGSLEDTRETVDHDLRNPIVLLRRGIQGVLSGPGYLLHSLGLSAAPNPSGPLLRIASGIVALIGLVAAVMTTALGWPAFSTLLASLVGP